MYTKLLKEILQNEINLNVIIDKDSKTGLVYKDEINKYIKMKSSEIVDSTMEKLKNQLLLLNEYNNTLFDEIKDYSKIMITKKYIDYVKNNNNIKINVNNLVNNTYLEQKNKAIQIYDNYKNINPIKDINTDKKGF
jgi:pyruvate/2-oxoacid:ferredoxin oxidoreductase beta subunit